MYRTLKDAPDGGAEYLARYTAVRGLTERLAAPLSPEDQSVQSMPDASPAKWHLAHTTWFFETLILMPHAADYRPYDERFLYLFNSYYEALGPRHPRPQRGLLTRPTADEVFAYRRYVDGAMARLFETAGQVSRLEFEHLAELGLHHEQQHQELLLTDIKHAFWSNPLHPAYYDAAAPQSHGVPALEWLDFAGGIVPIGAKDHAFAFDNERPRHLVFLVPFRLASRPVTCGEYLGFIEDGGYARPEFWLSDGWATVQAQGWDAPLYWMKDADGTRSLFTLHGPRPLDPFEPVTHVSLYEAAAYAAWAGKRLPTEFEWESAAADHDADGQFLDPATPHPKAAPQMPGMTQLYGSVWQWTRSAYEPYPGYKPLPGAAAEYNGKFMSGQMVLRGGSCATPEGHIRPSYRNFFPPSARWQFSGIRLAEDA